MLSLVSGFMRAFGTRLCRCRHSGALKASCDSRGWIAESGCEPAEPAEGAADDPVVVPAAPDNRFA